MTELPGFTRGIARELRSARTLQHCPAMTDRSTFKRVLLGVLLLVLGGCQTLGSSAKRVPTAELAPSGYTLTLIVSELQMHLNDDTYRMRRPVTADGRDVFAVALWRISLVQRERPKDPAQWENGDIVLEYARARALERLRRYEDSADAYARVANTGSILADHATEGHRVMRIFARDAGDTVESIAGSERELELLEARVDKWRELAWEYRGTLYEPLALEQAEAWEMLRADWIARNGELDAAIAACQRLVERHHPSKLYAKHLIRLGDRYAEAVQRVHLRSRAKLAPFDEERYEALLDQALSAYELAGEERKSASRREARMKIEVLLAYHRGTVAHAP